MLKLKHQIKKILFFNEKEIISMVDLRIFAPAFEIAPSKLDSTARNILYF